jgi:hypothetical protein
VLVDHRAETLVRVVAHVDIDLGDLPHLGERIASVIRSLRGPDDISRGHGA